MARIKPVIVVIEDDAKFRRLLRTSLRAQGYDVHEADQAKSGLVLAANRKPDLIILDLGLPDLDGSDVIAQIRKWWSDRPILVLSGRGAPEEKIAALEAGADDYIVKPISLEEMLARVRAALRRSARSAAHGGVGGFAAGGVSVDIFSRTVTRNGIPVTLTPNEFRVLAVLVKRAGLFVTADALINELWGPNSAPNNRQYLRGYLAALRKKLESNPAAPVLLQTEAGVGYRIVPDDTGASRGGPTRDPGDLGHLPLVERPA
jgi:two-component system KDP operon response regulator KdpE